MAKVKMLTSISGADGSAAPGDMWECSADEAERLIEKGLAERGPGRPPGRKARTASAAPAGAETASVDV